MSRFPQAHFLLSCADAAQFPADVGAEVAIAGRSNSGKSSAINAITGRHSLARTSKTPGQTRLLNFFEIQPRHRIVDLPGYGYAEVHESERRQWVGLIDQLRRRNSLVGLFLIVDIRRGVSQRDMELLSWAGAVDCVLHVLLTKSDKATQLERVAATRQAQALLSERATVQVFSAQDKTGVVEAQQALTRMFGIRRHEAA
jgi:GTP-binding protein